MEHGEKDYQGCFFGSYIVVKTGFGRETDRGKNRAWEPTWVAECQNCRVLGHFTEYELARLEKNNKCAICEIVRNQVEGKKHGYTKQSDANRKNGSRPRTKGAKRHVGRKL